MPLIIYIYIYTRIQLFYSERYDRSYYRFVIIIFFIFIYNSVACRQRRLSDASRSGGPSQQQSNIHQSRYLRDETQMEDTAEVVGTEIGGEKFEKQT